MALNNAEYVIYGTVVKAVSYTIDDGISFRRTMYLVRGLDDSLRCVGITGTPPAAVRAVYDSSIHPELDQRALFLVERGPVAIANTIPDGYENRCTMYIPSVPGERSVFIGLGEPSEVDKVGLGESAVQLTEEPFGGNSTTALSFQRLLDLAKSNGVLEPDR